MTNKLINKNQRVNRIKAKMHLSQKDGVIVINKTSKHLEAYLQLGNRIVGGASTKSKDISKMTTAQKIEKLADKMLSILKANKVEKVVFNRNGNLYTGKIKLLADSIRQKGIKI